MAKNNKNKAVAETAESMAEKQRDIPSRNSS